MKACGHDGSARRHSGGEVVEAEEDAGGAQSVVEQGQDVRLRVRVVLQRVVAGQPGQAIVLVPAVQTVDCRDLHRLG